MFNHEGFGGGQLGGQGREDLRDHGDELRHGRPKLSRRGRRLRRAVNLPQYFQRRRYSGYVQRQQVGFNIMGNRGGGGLMGGGGGVR